MSDNGDDPERRLDIIALAIVALAIVLAVVVFASYRLHFPGDFSTNSARWGQFGDYFGGALNPLLAFLALMALLLTVRLQASELRNSTKELKTSADALKLQATLIRDQAEEATFFRVIELHLRVLESMTVSRQVPSARGVTETIFFSGRAAIDDMYKALKDHYGRISGDDHVRNLALTREFSQAEYEQQQAPYLESVSQLLMALRDLPQEIAVQRGRIVKGLLSPTERSLLLYHALHETDSELTKLIIESAPIGALTDRWLLNPVDRTDALRASFPNPDA